MTRLRRMFGSALVYTVTSAITSAIPFLMLPVLTRVLSPEDYGSVAMFSVVVAVFGAFTGLSVHGAVGVRYFDLKRAEFARYVGACLTILATSTAVVMLVVALLLPWLEEFTKLSGTWLLLAVAASSAQFIIQTRLVIWQCATQPWSFGALRVTQAAVDATSSLVLVLAVGLAWQGRATGILLGGAIAAAIALVSLYRGKWVAFPFERRHARNALKFGVPLIPHALGGMLIAVVDRFMISNIIDVASTGIYMVALQIGMILGVLTDAFNRACAPWIIESLGQRNPATDRAVVRFTYTYFAVLLAVALVLGFLAPWLLVVLVGEQFRGASELVIYITTGCAFIGMYYMVANHIFFAQRTGRLAAMTLASGFFNVCVSYLLLTRNGVLGAAQATMLAQGFLFCGTWWLANKAHPMPWLRALAPLRAGLNRG